MKRSVFLAIPLLIAGLARGQHLSGEFNPSPVMVGVPITFTATNMTGNILKLSSPCGWYTIHKGTQNGQVIPTGVFCIQVIVNVSPGATTSFSWNQKDAFGAQVPKGRYWIEARSWDSVTGVAATDWFCISVQGQGDPALTAGGIAKKGGTLPLKISAPNDPLAVYFVGLSLSENNPVSVLGLDLCLSAPISSDHVSSAIGALDSQGRTTAPSVTIPNLAFLVGVGFHTQAALLSNGLFKTTNALSFTIHP